MARELAGREGTSTILLERHDAPGTETSSRNSEVRDSNTDAYLGPLRLEIGYAYWRVVYFEEKEQLKGGLGWGFLGIVIFR